MASTTATLPGATSTTLTVQVQTPLGTLFKWGLTLLAWGHFFNFLVVSTNCRWSLSCMLGRWYEYLFFPFTLLFRWTARGVRIASAEILPTQCSTWQRLLLGGQYCDRAARVDAAIKEHTAAGSLTQEALDRCSG